MVLNTKPGFQFGYVEFWKNEIVSLQYYFKSDTQTEMVKYYGLSYFMKQNHELKKYVLDINKPQASEMFHRQILKISSAERQKMNKPM